MEDGGFVLDNSVSMAWCFPEEQSPYAQAVLRALPSTIATVPTIWPLEAANVLLTSERRGRLTQADSVTFLSLLSALPITIDAQTSERAFGDTMNLARARSLSAYDAAYLELAIRKGLPLASLDDKLKTAALAVGVPLFSAS